MLPSVKNPPVPADRGILGFQAGILKVPACVSFADHGSSAAPMG